MRLKGKTALIAGAGRNNGKAIALTFAREGADLILVARRFGDELKQVAEACQGSGVQVLPLLADVGKQEDVNRVVKLGLERFGKVDVLVCVAGMRPHKVLWEYTFDEWQQVFAVNLHATFHFVKALVPGMMERKSGNIIALGGKASLTSQPAAAAVVASKHGLYGLIKSLATDLGPYGIRANLLALSHIEHDRHDRGFVAADSSLEDTLTPLRREGKNQEVANTALFLASDESSYITGDRIHCGGGRYM